MPEKIKTQHVPVKVYKTEDLLMVAAPLPGLQPEDITITVTNSGKLVIHGDLRGVLKDIKELLIDEWSVGSYHRELQLPIAVNGEHANVTYGNGVIVVALPMSQESIPATLTLEKVGTDRGEYVGHVGHVRS